MSIFKKISHHGLNDFNEIVFHENISKLNNLLINSLIPELHIKIQNINHFLKETDSTNVNTNISSIISNITSQTTYKYFFKQIKEPYWFEPLYKKGIFSSESITNEAMNYLHNISTQLPSDRLADLCIDIAKETDDRIIKNYIIEIFLQIDAKESVKLYPYLNDWKENNLQYTGYHSKYITTLLKGGYTEEAYKLFKSWFTPQLDENKHQLWPFSNIKCDFDIEDYKDYLFEIGEKLNSFDSTKSCSALINLINTYIVLLDKDLVKATWFIRKAIEPHKQNRDEYFDALIDTFINIYGISSFDITNILPLIEKEQSPIFKRISIYLRNKHIDIDINGTNKLLSDTNIYEDFNYHHELFHLLEDNFDKLNPKAQQTYYQYIEKVADEETINKYLNKKATEDEINKYRKYKKYEKLWPIRKHLNNQYKTIFEEYSKEFKKPEHPDFLIYSESGFEHEAGTKEINNLNETSIGELIETINKPLKHPMELEANDGTYIYWDKIITSNPKEISDNADKFKIIKPQHIDALISSCADYLKIGTFERYDKLFEFLQWIVDQPRAIPNYDGPYKDLNPGWVWTRKSIARFINELFLRHPNDIKLEYRNTIWDILKPLTEDLDPINENIDIEPAESSINTVRGYAFHAMIRYAIWLNQTHDIKGGFDAIPEVKNILDRHLNINNEPALSIRSVYGQWFPWLTEIDKSWANNNKKKIFPLDEENSSYFDAAWITYITFNKPYKPCFEILTDEYKHAIGLIGDHSEDNRYLKNPDNALAEHLIFYYTWGLIDLKKENHLIDLFFKQSTPKLRGELIHHIGWVLYKFKEKINEQVKERLITLWEWFKERPRETSQDYDDLQYIGWWILSDNFDPQWCLEQILYALDKCNKIEPAKDVIERIFDLAEIYPLPAINYLNAISNNEEYNWVLQTNKRKIENLIKEHFTHDKYINETKSLIDKLIQNDVYFFGDLVNLIPDKYRES
jgi:hypothetical protein